MAKSNRWLDTDQEGKKFYAPRPEQCVKLLSVVGDVDAELYLEAIETDKLNFKRNQEWSTWREIHRYPAWATVEKVDDEVWYHHHHCGRSTNDLAEVTSYQILSVEMDGVCVSVLQEDWIEGSKSWRSIAIQKDDSVNLMMLSKHLTQAIEWQETERFYFGIVLEK